MVANLEGWKKYVLIYLAVLGVSHLAILFFQNPTAEKDPSDNRMKVQVVDKDQSLAENKITIAYKDIYKGNKANPEVLVLLPGGPEGPKIFEDIIPKLAPHFRVVIPHLPGYNGQNDHLPSYSFNTLSVYTAQFLDQLDISKAHLFGFGLGGASAVHLAHKHPQKISSLGLIASIGVQELELLGSYRLNHAVHGIQLGAVWVLHNLVPHFGLFEAIDIDVSYAKKHFESDQRPIRSHLQDYEKPMLILHGDEDPLVPLAAAQEHHRIVPQSEIKLFEADHDILETHSDSVSSAIKSFIRDVKNGQAATSGTASDERIKEADKSFSKVDFAKFEGVSLLIIMLILILGMFISEDLTCISAGLLVARGLIGFWPATVACFIGIFIGDVGLYTAGRILGRPAIQRAPLKWVISPKDLEKSSQWFKAKGPAIIMATRFLPGSRMPTYFSAGVVQAGFWMFIFYFILSAIIWVPMLVGLSKLLGNELLRYFSMYQGYAEWVLLGTVIFFVVIIKLVIPAFSYKGRRLLVSRYRKLTHWQYWWSMVVYAPLLVYALYLGLKYRSLTLFTVTNPAVTYDGFMRESKSDMLDLFQDKSAVARYCKLCFDSDYKKMLDAADQFMHEEGISYPIVLKPEVGRGGRDVEIINDRYQMQDYLDRWSEDVIVQEFVEGVEVDIIYYRRPQDENGTILAIARKELPKITGDGEKTVQELILSGDTTVTMAPTYLRENEDQLYSIPEQGETITLVNVGAYSRGATITNDKQLITEKLTQKIDSLCKKTDSFYMGQLNVKVPSYEELKRGNGLKIIELNGITSVPSYVYDQCYSFFEAQKLLIEQYRLAFEIGAKNRNKGSRLYSLKAIIKSCISNIMTTDEN